MSKIYSEGKAKDRANAVQRSLFKSLKKVMKSNEGDESESEERG